MPPKRRGGRAKAKVKSPRVLKAESSSAEDTDESSAKEIVKRLAKKYLLKSSSGTEDSDQKENRVRRGQITDPYDADLETDGNATTTSDMECQTEDISSLMDQSSVLSPSRKTNTNKQSTVKETSQRRKRGKQASAAQKTKQKTLVTYQKQKNTSKRKSDTEQASRGSQTDSESESQPTRKNGSHSLQQSDSGFFISPLSNRPLPKLPKMNASDTSTPSSVIGGHKSLDDSCFGFDNIMSPQGLPFSPVDPVSPSDHRPCSAMSGLSSLQGSLQGSMTSGTSSILSPPKRKYDNVVLTGLIPGESDQSELPVAKKPKRKKTQVKKDDQEWASKMSAEFDDIDMYELTIEG